MSYLGIFRNHARSVRRPRRSRVTLNQHATNSRQLAKPNWDSPDEFRWVHLSRPTECGGVGTISANGLHRCLDLDAVPTREPTLVVRLRETVVGLGNREDASLTRQTVPSEYIEGDTKQMKPR